MLRDGTEVKTISGFPNYAISRDGRVWSFPRRGSHHKGIWLAPNKMKNGYLTVGLCQKGKVFRKYIHRLVLESYVGNSKNHHARHLNGLSIDNRLENLVWGTRKENEQDKLLHGSRHVGEKHSNAKLTAQKVRQLIYEHRTGLFSFGELAVQFNISITTAWQIINKKRWKHLWTKVA